MNTNLQELLDKANATGHKSVLAQCESLLIQKYPNMQYTKSLLDECANFCLTRAYDTNRSIENIVDLLIIED